MSVKVMALVWDAYRPDVDQKLVLLALADWCDDEGKCRFSESEVAERTRLEVGPVRATLASLVEDGTLTTIPKYPGCFRLQLDRLSQQETRR